MSSENLKDDSFQVFAFCKSAKFCSLNCCYARQAAIFVGHGLPVHNQMELSDAVL